MTLVKRQLYTMLSYSDQIYGNVSHVIVIWGTRHFHWWFIVVYNIEFHRFYVYVYQRCSQTLAATCRIMDIFDVFKKLGARESISGFLIIAPTPEKQFWIRGKCLNVIESTKGDYKTHYKRYFFWLLTQNELLLQPNQTKANWICWQIGQQCSMITTLHSKTMSN